MYSLNSEADTAGQTARRGSPPSPSPTPSRPSGGPAGPFARMSEALLSRLLSWAAGPTGRPTPLAPPARQRLLDAALAVAFALVAVRYAISAPNAPVGPLDVTLLAACTPLPLAWRRRTPLVAGAAQLPLATALLLRHAYPDVLFVAAVIGMVALYSTVAYSPYRRLALAGLPFSGAVLVVLFSRAKLPHFPNSLVGALLVFPVVVAALGHRIWMRRAEESRARLRTLRRNQIEALGQAVEHERGRIARELHDVVTHNVSVMVIQAGAARMVVDKNPAVAREALLAIEASGRAAMADLRHVMGLLTMVTPGDDPAERAPQPGLDGLEALVSRIQLTGIDITLSVTGERRALPPVLELTAYRVVQEALTNMVKHAVGASAAVRIDHLPRELSIEVVNTEGRPSEAAVTGSGKGLAGLRDRLAVYGGTLHTGPRLTGGYRVIASLPLELEEDL